MNQTQDKEVQNRKFNMKLYPTYEMIGYDVLFFYGIRVMFLSEVKGFTNSQIVLSSTLFAIYSIIFQSISTLIISKIGKKNGAITGNILLIFWAVLIMAIKSFTGLALAQLFFALAFTFKGVSEAGLLGISIPDSRFENEIFTSIDKRGFSRYCILSAITVVSAGYLYEINPYIPMVLCLIFILIATIISFNFAEIEKKKDRTKENRKYIEELKEGFRFTMKSKRLRSLFIFTGVIWGVIALLDLYELALLQFLNVDPFLTGIIFAGIELVKGIFARLAPYFNKLFKNKSLVNISAVFSVGFILIGCVSILQINHELKIWIIAITLLILAALNGIAIILAKKYFNNFSNDEISPSIYTVKTISDNFFRIITTVIGSTILVYCNIDVSILIFGLILMIATVLIFNFAKNKLGLSPDEYSKKDIYIIR